MGLRNIMTKIANVDIDYEHMDDLPLSKHFEWPFFQIDKVNATKNLSDAHNKHLARLITTH